MANIEKKPYNPPVAPIVTGTAVPLASDVLCPL